MTTKLASEISLREAVLFIEAHKKSEEAMKEMLRLRRERYKLTRERMRQYMNRKRLLEKISRKEYGK